MFCRHFLPLLLCGLLVCLGKSSASKKDEIGRIADSEINSKKWSYSNDWRGKSSYANKWKCNLFVYDVLREANAKPPTRRSSWLGHYPIGANEWANPNSQYIIKTGCYKTVQYGQEQKGDIIAFERRSSSGHMGVVSSRGLYISAGKDRVTQTSISSIRGESDIARTTIWRYTC